MYRVLAWSLLRCSHFGASCKLVRRGADEGASSHSLQKRIFVPGVTSGRGTARLPFFVLTGLEVLVLLGLEVVMRSIKRLARATTTWLIRAGLGNDLTTLSDRDLRDVGLVREQIGKASKLFVLT